MSGVPQPASSRDSSVPLQPPSQLALLPTWPGTQSRREEGKQEVLQGTGASQVTPRGCQLCLCVEELGLQSWQQRQEKYRQSRLGSAGSRRCGSSVESTADAAESISAGGCDGYG